MFRASTIILSSWALSASHLGFLHPVTIAALALPWFLYEAYTAMITADDKTLDSVSPEHTIIIFDMHGVLFKSNVFDMIKVIAFSPCAGRIFLHCLNPFFLYELIDLRLQHYIPEYCILFLAKKYDSLQPCVPLLLRVANLQIPQWKTIDLVQQLKNRGYKLHLFSNIGEHLFADLQEQYPDLFSLFDAISIGSPVNNYRGKPHPSAFYHYIVTHPAHGKQRLLIDDSARNIAFARAFNIAGIRYRSAGSLLKWFKSHGIL